MLEPILNEAIKIIASVVMPYVAYQVRQTSKKNFALQEGVKALLCDRIIQKSTHLCKKGNCSTEDWNSLDELNRSYHALGGNGTVKELMKRVKNLPLGL